MRYELLCEAESGRTILSCVYSSFCALLIPRLIIWWKWPYLLWVGLIFLSSGSFHCLQLSKIHSSSRLFEYREKFEYRKQELKVHASIILACPVFAVIHIERGLLCQVKDDHYLWYDSLYFEAWPFLSWSPNLQINSQRRFSHAALLNFF